MSLGGSITFQTPKKKRKRFSDPENQKLVDIVLANIQQLFGATALNAAGKASVWDKVMKEVNKVEGMKRTAEECKKRWNDYKRRVKQTIDNQKLQPSMGGQMLPLSEMLTKRQMMVAQYFKMDASHGQNIEVHDEYSSNKGECVSSIEPFLSTSCTVDSEDEFHPSQNISFSSTSHQDKYISQSSQEPQDSSQPWDPDNTEAVDTSLSSNTTINSQLQLKAQIDQLAAQQNNFFQVLKGIQESVTASLNIQKGICNVVKGSFLELQKTLLSGQKASSDHSDIMEFRLKSLQAKLDEMNSILQVKHLQEIISTDGSELGSSGTQDTRSTPSLIHTPAATCTPKNNTPARKRAVDQSTSSAGFIKKKK
ncbi:uncharacterized protein LOC122926944 isoform X2 [Bufo gargarizans]|nr:uncharacterized protein LOC122926944 isoform X2 [Bufo gargarizans]